MNGNELLWSRSERPGGLDISLAAEDLELNRLCMLLFPTLGTDGALSFSASLLTDDGETIRMRQAVIRELLEHPDLAAALERLLQFWNAPTPMLDTEAGTVISARLVQPEKT